MILYSASPYDINCGLCNGHSQFGLYGFFSDQIAEVFFPPSEKSESFNLIMSYVVFGGAFLMRPLGGCIAGHIGDVHGRKRSLTFSMFMMCIPTVAMGCLPTYQQVGGLSTALLVVCRLMQGFSVGGQLPSSLVYTLDAKPKEHWGFYGSLVHVSLFLYFGANTTLRRYILIHNTCISSFIFVRLQAIKE